MLKRIFIFQNQAINWAFLWIDLILIVLAGLGSFAIRIGWGELFVYYLPQSLKMAGIALIIKPVVYHIFGLYRRSQEYNSSKELWRVFIAVTIASSLLSITMTISLVVQSGQPDALGFPRTALVIDWILSLIFASQMRFSYKSFIENQSSRTVSDLPRQTSMVDAGNIRTRIIRTIRNDPLFRTHVYKGVAFAICSIGIFLRVHLYGINRSLWADEASLALNLVKRPFLDLFKPLDYNQGAPLGFLAIQKFIISLLGEEDYILRLIPLLAGILSVPLMYSVSRQYLGQFSSLISLGLFALSPRLIYYSSEVKQYSTDVFATLILLYLASKCLIQPKPQISIKLGIAGVLLTWISHPSAFVFAGIVLALGLSFTIKREEKSLIWLVGIGAGWAINFGINYLVSLRSLASNYYLLDYWMGAFAPWPPWMNFSWYSKHFTDFLIDPARLPVNGIIVGLLILGIISMGIRRWQLMSILVAQFLLTLMASTLGKYPFAGRLLLFLIPFLLIFLAEGIERIHSMLFKINKLEARLVYIALIIYCLFGPVIMAYAHLYSPPVREDIKSVMSYMRDNHKRGDLIYVYYSATAAFEFYAHQYGFIAADYSLGTSARENPSHYLDEIEQLREPQRIWVIFTTICSHCKVDEKEFILDYLDENGIILDQFSSTDASVYLYKWSQTPNFDASP